MNENTIIVCEKNRSSATVRRFKALIEYYTTDISRKDVAIKYEFTSITFYLNWFASKYCYFANLDEKSNKRRITHKQFHNIDEKNHLLYFLKLLAS